MKTTEEIKEYLRQGDWVKVAQITRLNYDNARKAFNRPGSKRHSVVVKAARKVAQFNQKNGI